MLLVTLALKTLLSISQNGISPITLSKQLGNHINIINASRILLFGLTGVRPANTYVPHSFPEN
jgi:hypothetical protein